MGLFDKLKEPQLLKETSDAKVQLQYLTDYLKTAPNKLKPMLEQDLKMVSYGIAGEENILFELKNSHLPMYVLHDIYLECDGLTAQIDYIVFTKKVIFVLECKNLIGNIEINANGDFIRTLMYGKNKKEGIYSPITQNQRHLELLKKVGIQGRRNFITKALFEKYFDNNYKSLIVLANPKTIVNMKFAKKAVKEKIIRSDQLIQYIKNINNASTNSPYTDNEMLETATFFLNAHKENKVDYFKKYKEQDNHTAEPDTVQLTSIPSVPELLSAATIAPEPLPVATIVPAIILPITELKNETLPPTSIPSSDKPLLVEELKFFRLNKSREEKIKPYFIFNNSQMSEIIQHMPTTNRELIQISGFGEVKCNKYGLAICTIIKKHK